MKNKTKNKIFWLACFLIFFVVLTFFFKPFIKFSLKYSVVKLSDSLYFLSFDDLKINPFSEQYLLINFRLEPNQSVINKKNLKKTFYLISVDTFLLSKINFWKFFSKNKIFQINQIGIHNLKIKIFKSKTDTIRKKSFRKVVDDIVNGVFSFVDKIEVRNFYVKHTDFQFVKSQFSKYNFTAYDISFSFDSLELDKKVFENYNRVFYSDFKIFIKGYQVPLGDSLYLLKSKNVMLSTKEKLIKLTDFEIVPQKIRNKNFFNFSVSNIQLKSVDIKKFFKQKQLLISKAEFESPVFYEFIFKTNKQLNLKNFRLFPLYKKYLSLIKIDTLQISKGSFAKFNKLSSYPNLKVDSFNIVLFGVRMDSLADFDTSKILYSKDYLLNFFGFRYLANDSLHIINSDFLGISSFNKQIVAKNFSITPKFWDTIFAKKNLKSLNKIHIPSLKISGILLNKLIFQKKLILKQLKIYEPQILITNFTDSTKAQRSKVVFKQLLHNTINFVSIGFIDLQKGQFLLKTIFPTKKIITNGKLSFSLWNFNFNPYQKKINKFFYANYVNLLFTDYQFVSSDNIHIIKIDTVKINQKQKKFQLINFRILPNFKILDSLLIKKNKYIALNLFVPQIEISNFNTNDYFLENQLIIQKLKIPNPKIKILYFPNIYAKKYKKGFIDSLKLVAQNKIISIGAQVKINSYVSAKEIDSTFLRNYIYKQKVIDSIVNFSTRVIDRINILPKNIRITDTTIPLLELIADTITYYIKSLQTDTLTQQQIRHIFQKSKFFLQYILAKTQKPKISKKDIVNFLKNIINIIRIDTFWLTNTQFALIDKSQKDSLVFENTVYLKLFKFYFNKDSLDSLQKRIFFADSFWIKILKLNFKLPDKLHIIRINSLIFRSMDSTLTLNLINLSPKFSFKKAKKSNIYTFTKKIVVKHLQIWKLIYANKFIAEKLVVFDNGILLNIFKRKNKNRLPEQIILPANYNYLKINKIVFKNSSLTINSNNKKIAELYFNLTLSNLSIDSVFMPKKNKFFLPIDSIDFNATYLKIYLKKFSVFSDSLSVKDNLSDFYFQNLKVFSKQDTSNWLILRNIFVKNFDFSKYRSDSLIWTDTLKIDFSEIELPAKKQTDNFSLKSFDLYKFVKKFTKELKISFLSLDSLNIFNKKKNVLKNASVFITDLLVNEKTDIFSPNLFYSKNLVFVYRNFSRLTKDKLFKLHFDTLKLQTQNQQITLRNFYYKPLKPPFQIQKIKSKYRITVADVFVDKIIFADIDFRKLIDSQYIDIHKISLRDGEANFFVDLNVQHDTIKKKHYVELFLDYPKPLNIDIITVRNFKISYSEISNITKDTAFIYIDKINASVRNITNNKNLIEKKDLETQINLEGFLQGQAKVSVNLLISLKERGNFSKMNGTLYHCDATIFNSYTINGFNIKIDKGTINKATFNIITKDTIAIGKMLLLYSDLKTSILKGQQKKQKRRFLSWITDLFLRNENPKYGIFFKVGAIGYIHDPAYSDIKMWIRAILSGVQSTIAFESKDVKKIKRKYRLKIFKDKFPDLFQKY